MRSIILLLFVATLSAFTWSKKPIEPEIKPIPYPPIVAETPPVDPTPVEEPKTRMALYWENTTEAHPERAPWSDELVGILTKDFVVYDAALDWNEICPKFDTLDQDAKIKAMAEFWVAVAYHESAFKPGQESVDVGNKSNKDTWSVGLYQMSATDNAAKAEGVNYQGLKDPVKNIRVAMNQFKRQVMITGKVLLDKSSPNRYWAVILKRGKYQKIDNIKTRVLKQVPVCK